MRRQTFYVVHHGHSIPQFDEHRVTNVRDIRDYGVEHPFWNYVERLSSQTSRPFADITSKTSKTSKTFVTRCSSKYGLTRARWDSQSFNRERVCLLKRHEQRGHPSSWTLPIQHLSPEMVYVRVIRDVRVVRKENCNAGTHLTDVRVDVGPGDVHRVIRTTLRQTSLQRITRVVQSY